MVVFLLQWFSSFVPTPTAIKLYSCSNGSRVVMPLLSFGDGVNAKSSEVGGRGEEGGGRWEGGR
jgi:hypothetical protein